MTKARTLADNFAADINQVNAGVGITGGGTSGTVTITNDMATTINAAGDLLYGTANDAYTRLGIGTAGQYLKVNSGATAPEWATLSAGGMTLISTTTISGNPATVTISSIPSTYNQLFLLVEGLNLTANGAVSIRINNTTVNDYFYSLDYTGTLGGEAALTKGYIPLHYDLSSDVLSSSNQLRSMFGIVFSNYTSTTSNKTMHAYGYYLSGSAGGWIAGNIQGGLNQQTPAAITSVSLYNRTSFFSAGTLKLYGVS